MPKWDVHDKWAERMGLSKEVATFVNHLSDFPDQSQEFRDFCEHEGADIISQLVSTRDFSMIMKIPKYLQLAFMRQKGSEYVTAWYLHYVLDYIRMAPALTAEEILKRTEDRFEPCQELELVKQFVTENAAEIVHDCRE
ncbi:MAG: hypothetical protein QMD22_09010 [archaeon]|nr:hypothetical protein [archaeon]